MTTYVIGDVQGCLGSLHSLLTKLHFDPASDRLLFTGDLVNRGPRSLETLQFIRGLGKSAEAVLGNHDLHLIARFYGKGKSKKSDTIDDILTSKSAADLIGWLVKRPFALQEGQYLLVHAGLATDWTLKKIESITLKLSEHLNDRVLREELLAGEKFPDDIRTLTTIRMCNKNGELLRYSGPPEQAPAGSIPWFVARDPALNDKKTVLFGHWAALGARKMGGYICLDSGCVWGGKLTALRLSDQKLISVPAVES